ncbi:hypothetical protein V5O48_012511 [Marasmius crinis-equi]|uniref:CxC2-like cysteine cluster KDZ transposase-associated domain-containing protein n=1 Tax=Marasmius crinis-equi TaxID=585013 RepID=A0ABR3F2J9_9AGAR
MSKRKPLPPQLRIHDPVEPGQAPPGWTPSWFADDCGGDKPPAKCPRQDHGPSEKEGAIEVGGSDADVQDEVEEERGDNESGEFSGRPYQGASEYMRQFMEKRHTILDYMLTHESTFSLGGLCECGEGTITCFCDECQHYTPSCEACFVLSHGDLNPWHWAKHWEDDTIVERDVTDLTTPGHIVTIGHARHEPACCEEAVAKVAMKLAQAKASKELAKAEVAEADDDDDDNRSHTFTVIHINGIHTTRVAFCDCYRTDGMGRFEKLLQSRIFPSSVSKPRIGMTFEVMRDFHVHTLTSKKSAYDYVAAIQQKSSCALPSETKDVYRQFIRAHRVWSALLAEKRAGLAHSLDKHFPNRRPDSIVVPCYTCPERNFNVDDVVMDTVPRRYIHVVQLTFAADGHFGLQRFKKVDDPDDVSLLPGQGLFPADSEYKPYLRSVVMTSEEASRGSDLLRQKTTCSNFNAVDMQNKLKFKGCEITGVVGIECGRHSVFLAMVDLHKGERFANVDFALARALRQYVSSIVPFQSLEAAKFFGRILMTYDVACVFQVHIRDRFNANFNDLASIIDAMYLLVPKMHLYGHKEDCRFQFALNFLLGAGRIHGEGIEPSWAETKQSGGSTRQMNHGHRHDKLNDYHNYWNWRKMEGSVEYLAEHLLEALEQVEKHVAYFIATSLLNGRQRVETWAAQHDKSWVELTEAEKKKWKSPYQLHMKKLISQANVLKNLEQAEVNAAKGRSWSSSSNLTIQWINMGMSIQAKQTQLRAKIKSFDVDEIDALRNALTRDLQELRELQLRDIPALGRLVDKADELDEGIEKETLFLPSDIVHPEVIKKFKIIITPQPNDPFASAIRLGECGSIELELRKGQANDAVENLCNVLLHVMLLVDTKNRHARGVQQNLRSMKYIKRVTDKKSTWSAIYSHARRCILQLEAKEEDADFPELKPHHLYTKNAGQSVGLGQGSVTDSWIWTYGSLRDMDDSQKADFLDEVKRVRWFRTRAEMWRWIEEKEVLEEFRRYIAACERMSMLWKDVSGKPPVDSSLNKALKLSSETALERGSSYPPNTSGYTIYALQKSRYYRRMADYARQRFTAGDLDGGWPAEGQSLWEYLDERRPNTEIPWDKHTEDSAEELAKWERDIIRIFEKPDEGDVL